MNQSQLSKDRELLEGWKKEWKQWAFNNKNHLGRNADRDAIWEFIVSLLSTQSRIIRAEEREKYENDKSWLNWEEDFGSTWMDINPSNGQANAKAYVKSLVDKYVRIERQRAAEIFRKETEGVCHAACNKPLYLGYIYQKTLTPDQDE